MNERIRALFPVTREYIYLNHAAIGPLSTPVVKAMQAYLIEASREGSLKWPIWMKEAEGARQRAAQLIGAQPHEIAFMRNTSDGLAAIANGLDWRPGDNVVACDCEFPANIYPWMRLATRGVELRLAHERDGRIALDDLFALVDDRTRVITVSFVQFGSGFRMDLGAIGAFCRERRILFVVDAIQGLGALSLDVHRDRIDALSADAHKFLLGPEGIAILFISERLLDRIEPTVVGWTSVKYDFDRLLDYRLEYRDGAARFEPGSLNTIGVRGLRAALDLLLDTGIERIESYLLGLTEYLAEGLRAKGYHLVSSRRPGEASAIVCCTHERYRASELCQRLAERRIITSHRLGRLRISPHFYNTREEIDVLLDALP
ncbi:MAG: aminotransferase class V-fold PLP-dependent enzyme [Acidobacteria bacterium]|nr:MAG: aminotransferase class V-fold PLP-dependent enzyme [Acidobacteriota bacterium]